RQQGDEDTGQVYVRLSGNLEQARALFLRIAERKLAEARRLRDYGRTAPRRHQIYSSLPGGGVSAPHAGRDGALGAFDLLAGSAERAGNAARRGLSRRLLGLYRGIGLFSGDLRLADPRRAEGGRKALISGPFAA